MTRQDLIKQNEAAARTVGAWGFFSGAKTVFALLFFINLFNYIDRQVLYAVFPLIKADLRVTDFELGMLASAFMVVYMLASPGIGWLADRGPRQRLIAISAMLWSVATAGGAFVKSYGQLLFARSFVGIGESGFTAISPSFLAERFPVEKRARVLALFTLALPAGSALGYLLGGKLGQEFGWRLAFLLVGVPGLLLGGLAFCLRDTRPVPRTEREGAPGLRAYAEFFGNRPYMYSCLALAMSTFTLGGFAAWTPTYFTRYFGMSVGTSGLVFGAMTVVAGGLGTLLGGFAADWLHRRTNKAYFLVTAGGMVLSLPFLVAGLSGGGLVFSLVMLTVAEVLVFVNVGPMNAAVVASTDVAVRSMAFALNIFIIHALGDAVSPMIIGALSDRFGLRFAMLACCAMMLVGAGFALAGARSLNFNSPGPEDRT